MRTLREVIDAWAVAQPDAPFLLAPEPGAVVTYSELRQSAIALDAVLAAAGIRPGEVVSYMLPNGISAGSVLLGAMYGGYVVSPVSLLAQDSQIAYTLAHSETRIVFTAPELVDRLTTLVARAGSRVIVRPTSPDDPALPESAGMAASTPAPVPASPAMLMYTSGTTGVPKGALLTHANMVHAGHAVSESLGLTAGDRVLPRRCRSTTSTVRASPR